jgi:predicted permease
MLRKNPGFTLVAVVTLALGIFANTAIFSAMNMLFRPLPVDAPDRLAVVVAASRDDPGMWSPHSYSNYRAVLDRNTAFTSLAAYKEAAVALTGDEQSGEHGAQQAEVLQGQIVSGNFFDVLGVRPALGRTFSADEDRAPGARPVVVLSHGVWQRRFRSDATLPGHTIYLNDHPFTVIGIAPAGFKGTVLLFEMDFWAPLMMQAQLGGSADWLTRDDVDLTLIGRLKPGVTRGQAEAQLRAGSAHGPQTSPGDQRTWFRVVSEVEARHVGVFLWMALISALALGVSGLVLLLACGNVANLLLARASARSREIVTRLALGAGAWRIIRQLLTESLLLALLGGGLGLLLTYWGADLMTAAVPKTTLALDFTPDVRVFAWAFSVALASALLFGLAPAWQAARTDVVRGLKNETGGSVAGARRFSPRNTLVIVQLALSMVVLVSGGLYVKTLHAVGKADLGFDTERLISMHLDPGMLGYQGAAARTYFAKLVRQAQLLPGVQSVSLAQSLPVTLGSREVVTVDPVVPEGEPPQLDIPDPLAWCGHCVKVTSVWPQHFETLGIRVLVGRDFTERDDLKAPAVAIVNQSAARRLFGSEARALGKRVRVGDNPKSAWKAIVGIAQDRRDPEVFDEPRPLLFEPFLQSDQVAPMMLVARARIASDLKSVARSLQREVQALDSRVPISELRTGDEHMKAILWFPRLTAGMAGTLAILALMLATVGLYSVMAYAVNLRTREIGIRIALGARSADVQGLVMRQGMLLTVIGVALGLVGSFVLTRLAGFVLRTARGADPLTLILIAALLVVVALLACYIPARRAMRVDPVVALRYE